MSQERYQVDLQLGNPGLSWNKIFSIKFNYLKLEFLNQAKNIIEVQSSSPIKNRSQRVHELLSDKTEITTLNRKKCRKKNTKTDFFNLMLENNQKLRYKVPKVTREVCRFNCAKLGLVEDVFILKIFLWKLREIVKIDA